MIHYWYLATSDECFTIETVKKQDTEPLHVWRVTVRHEDGGSIRFAITYFRGEWISNRELSTFTFGTPFSVINGFHGVINRMNKSFASTKRPANYVPDLDQALAEALGHRKPV